MANITTHDVYVLIRNSTYTSVPQMENHQSDLVQSYVAILRYCFLCLLLIGIVCNVRLITTVFSTKDLRTSPTYILLSSLAIGDVLLLFVAVVDILLIQGDGLTTDLLCRLICYIMVFSCAVSQLHLFMFSLFRYLILTRPFWTRVHVTSKKTVYVCISIWLTSCVVSVPILFLTGYNEFITDSHESIWMCSFNPGYAQVIVFLVVNLAAFGAMAGFHTAKAITLHQGESAPNRIQTRQHKTVSSKVVAGIIITYAIASIPFLIVFGFVHLAKDATLPKMFYTVIWPGCQCMLFTNSLANPLLYFFFSKNIQLCCNQRNN